MRKVVSDGRWMKVSQDLSDFGAEIPDKHRICRRIKRSNLPEDLFSPRSRRRGEQEFYEITSMIHSREILYWRVEILYPVQYRAVGILVGRAGYREVVKDD